MLHESGDEGDDSAEKGDEGKPMDGQARHSSRTTGLFYGRLLTERGFRD